jgi:poly(3-hydroxybutyrate) depolymerase
MKSLATGVLALTTLAGAFTLRAADPLVRREWTVDGVVRQALVYVPPQAATNPCPVVFAFHGHGGSMQNAVRSFAYHREWPEAIVVSLLPGHKHQAHFALQGGKVNCTRFVSG